MMEYADYEREFKDFCGDGRTMTGQEITQWVFSRLNVPHKELSFCADQMREKYIDTDKPLGRKVYYDVRFWTDGEGKLGYCFYEDKKDYVHVKRNLKMSPRQRYMKMQF